MEANLNNFEESKSSPLCTIENLIGDVDTVLALLQEVHDLPFEHHINDLHNMEQTADFSDIEELPTLIGQFVHLMQNQVRECVEKNFCIKTTEKITMTASRFKKGDYLLCHDDLCGNRHVAFVYYLTPNWTKNDGGALRFFDHVEGTNVPLTDTYREEYVPKLDSLIMFKVSDTSHHEVQEVLSEKARISINGWYHIHDRVDDSKSPPTFLRTPLVILKQMDSELLTKIVRPRYLLNESLPFYFMTAPSHKFNLFLTREFFDGCCKELNDPRLEWEVKGPPNHRRYEVSPVHYRRNKVILPEFAVNLTEFVKLLVSPVWLKYLNLMCDVNYVVFKEGQVPPVFMLEIQRWKEGFYSLLADNDFVKREGTQTLEVTFFFNVVNSKIGDDLTTDSEGSPTDMSGLIVFTTGAEFPYLKTLAFIKTERFKSSFYKMMRETTAKKTPILKRKFSKINKKLSAASLDRIKQVVGEKVKRIKQYRKTFDWEPQSEIHHPVDNCLLITKNSSEAYKYTSYIRHTGDVTKDNVKFHCVTVTYLIC